MSTGHDCVRPSAAGDVELWHCPECGTRWELLPPTPVTQPKPKRTISKGTVRALVATILGAGMVGGAAGVLPRNFVATLGCAVVLVVLSYWQNARSTPSAPEEGPEGPP
ncbi:hypothetical protein [Nonomuraea aridisoli]|uniref:hypothetical protein n=1 Tax=Nonomuraea aridisoli TaxID=2070368 RepID=UPI0011B93CBD|nr:hypothetical protein [Nonomuraea aridisoli]